MPVAPTYPGVYVEELPSGVHTITGVSTAVTAFLGYFLQGPMNTATQILGVPDLERNFGTLVSQSEASYAIRQFFANGGAEAWVVRVAANTSQNPLATASAAIVDTSGNPIATVEAANQGSWGNYIRLSIDHATTDPTSRFNLTVTQIDSSNPPVVGATEVYRNLTFASPDPNYAIDVINMASALIQFPAGTPPASTGLPEATGVLSSIDLSSGSVLNAVNGQTMTVEFDGTNLTPSQDLTFSGNPASLTALAAALQTQLSALPQGGPPALPGISVSVVPGSATERFLQVWASVPNSLGAGKKLAFSGQLATTLGLDSPTSSTVQQYALTGGGDGAQPDATALTGDPLAKTGIYALDTVAFNILCIPDVMNLDDTPAGAVISAAETFCAPPQGQTPRWAFYVVDVPQLDANRDDINLIQAWLDQNATLRSSYAALYYPRPQIPDPANAYRLRTVASSGTIAGLYARTDGDRGVWKAPAGTQTNLVSVQSLAYQMSDAENGILNPVAINGLRNLAVYGPVCWGARTLDGADQLASDWKYIPIRRTALFIEASLYQGLQWVVFEPNDEPLWSQIRLNVGTFMQGLFQQGAFKGSTPSVAYLVKCDSETTTQADVDLGVVNILVGFAPLKPAEFVILQIQQIAGQTPS